MIWIVIGAVAGAVLLAAVAVFFLFYFGLVNGYHPMKRAKAGQIKIACVGDSITYGCMVRNRGKNNYPAVLGRLLGAKYCVNNFGYTDRAVIGSADLPYVREKLYRQSLEFVPDIVFLMLGSNDSKERNWNRESFIADFGKIIDSYLRLPSAPKLYLLVPPPVFENSGRAVYKLRGNVIDSEICPIVRRLAEEKGVECLDIYSVFEGKENLFADGVHPNCRGSRLLARAVYDAVWGK